MLSQLYAIPTEQPRETPNETAMMPMARMVRDEWVTTFFRDSFSKDNWTQEDREKREEYLTLMLKEPAVSTAFWSLIASVMSLPMKVHAADPDSPKDVYWANFVRDAISGVQGGVPKMIANTAAGGLLFGFGLCEMVFDYPERGKWTKNLVLDQYAPLDSRFIKFDLDPFKRVVGVRPTKANGGQVFGPERFAIFSHQSLFGSPFGLSKFRPAYRAAKMMESAIKLRVILLQNFTGPFLVLKSGGATSRETAMRVLSEARALGYMVCDRQDEAEVLNMAAGSDSEFQSAIDDLRKEMYTAIRWGYLPFTEAASGVQVGNSEVQRSMTQLGEWMLATEIAQVFTEQIAKPLIRFNCPDDSVGFPSISLGGQNSTDKRAAGEIFEQAKRLNVILSKRQVQRALDIEEPAGKEDELRDPVQPGPGGGGGGMPPMGPAAPVNPLALSQAKQVAATTKPTDLDRAATLAVLDLQARAAMSGHPGRYQRAIDSLRAMVGHHAITQLAELQGGSASPPPDNAFGWMPARTRTGHVKAVGTGEHLGKTLYGPDAEGVLRPKEGAKSEPATATAMPKEQQAAGSAAAKQPPASPKQAAQKAASGKYTAEDLKAVVNGSHQLTPQESASAKAGILKSADNPPAVAGLAKSLAAHATGEKEAAGGPERNWTAGMNRGAIRFASKDQQELYDVGANASYALKGGRDKSSSKRFVKDTSAIVSGLSQRLGKPESDIHRLASDVYRDVKSQMSGLKDGETRTVRDNHIKPEAAAPADDKPKQARGKAAEILHAQLQSAPGLTDEHRQTYGAAVDRVTQAMPAKAHARLAKHLGGGVTFHADTAGIGSAVKRDVLSIAREDRHGAIEEKFKGSEGQKFGGGYVLGKGSVHIDGGKDGASPHEVYAHVLGHAIDGPQHEISNSDKWWDAFTSEIAMTPEGKYPLGQHAGRTPEDGFAEFSRLLYASDVPHEQVAAKFPRAMAVFKSHGLLPDGFGEASAIGPDVAANRPKPGRSTVAMARYGKGQRDETPNEVRLPMIFGGRLDVHPDGSHIDLLAGKPQPGQAEPTTEQPTYREQFQNAHAQGDEPAAHDLIAEALQGKHGEAVQAAVGDALDEHYKAGAPGGEKAKRDAILDAVAKVNTPDMGDAYEGDLSGRKSILSEEDDPFAMPAAKPADDEFPDTKGVMGALNAIGDDGKKLGASKPKLAGGDSLHQIVTKSGGIDPTSPDFLKHFEGVDEAVEYGIPRTVFKIGGREPYDIAKELHNEGHIHIEGQSDDAPDVDGTDHLFQQLATGAKSLHSEGNRFEQAEAENARREQDEAESRSPWKLTKAEFLKQHAALEQHNKQGERNLFDDDAMDAHAAEAQALFPAAYDAQKAPNPSGGKYSPEDAHRRSVETALREGRSVPANVLKDYPDLAPAKAAVATTATLKVGPTTPRAKGERGGEKAANVGGEQSPQEKAEPTSTVRFNPATVKNEEQEAAIPAEPKSSEASNLKKQLAENKTYLGLSDADKEGFVSEVDAVYSDSKIGRDQREQKVRKIADKYRDLSKSKLLDSEQPAGKPEEAGAGGEATPKGVHPKAAEKLNTAMATFDGDSLKNMLYPENKGLRGMFADHFGFELPPTAKGTHEVIDAITAVHAAVASDRGVDLAKAKFQRVMELYGLRKIQKQTEEVAQVEAKEPGQKLSDLPTSLLNQSHIDAFRQAREKMKTPGTMMGGVKMATDIIGLVSKQLGITEQEAEKLLVDGVNKQNAGAAEQKPSANNPHAAHVDLANRFAERFQSGEPITAREARDLADEVHGGTQGEGKYGPSDMYDSMEAGLNKSLTSTDPTADLPEAQRQAAELADKVRQLPTQTNRSGTKDSFQQFSTPPHYAFAANWVANHQPGDQVLEPSAGTGSLAIHAANAGTDVHVNELDPRRRAFLADLFGANKVHAENAEQIGGILPGRGIKPDTVVMNPPFSQTAGRMGDKKDLGVAGQHIKEALATMKPGGRLVAIVGRGMSPDSPTHRPFFDEIKKNNELRANVGISGDEYKKYGTAFGTRLLVIDKTGKPHSGETVAGDAEDIPHAMQMLEGVRNDRARTGQPAAGVATGGLGAAAVRGGRDPVSGTVSGSPGAPLGDQRDGARPADVPVEQVSPRTEGQTARTSEKPSERLGSEPVPAGSGPAQQGSGSEQGQPGPNVADLESATGGDGQPTVSGGKPKRTRKPSGGKSVSESAPSQPRLRPSRPVAVINKSDKPGSDVQKTKVAEPKATEQVGGENSNFNHYAPSQMTIEGAQPHTTPLVESAAMALVKAPKVKYQPNLSPDIIEKGLLSEAQLESLVYAGQAHSTMLPALPGQPAIRRGYFIGDGTGAGKGRQIAGIILDNMNQGRMKHIWLSQNDGKLFEDAKEFFEAIGGDPSKLFTMDELRKAEPPKDGILFVPYTKLHGGPTDKTKLRNLEEITKWCGDNFEGTINFDESHNMANAMDTEGGLGTKSASKQALAGLDLQRQLPGARVTYASATGATNPENLAYCERLGIWGPGTSFATKDEFVTQMRSGGLASMEAVANSLKAMGSYTARTLSPEGLTYERLTHELQDHEKGNYDIMSNVWQKVLQNIDKALEITQGDKGQAAGQFWSAQQRFFNQVMTAYQTSTVIKAMEEDIAAGRAPVVQLVNTMAAAADRAKKALGEGQSFEDMDISPREMLAGYLKASFPIHRWEEYEDQDGNIRKRPVLDSNGVPVEDPEAVRIRDELLADVEGIRHIVPKSPIDMIIHHFGPETVAEATSRGWRTVMKENEHGRVVLTEDNRGDTKMTNAQEAEAFQNGKKHIMVFSNAGGTGVSYHAGRDVANQKQRVHYVLQAGWQADKTVQGLGRTHRTNQVSAPIVKLVQIDKLPSQRRFISTIAARLDTMGALTRGQREASSGLFSASDSLEGDLAHAAMRSFFGDLKGGNIEDLNYKDTMAQLGFKIEDEDGGGRSRPREEGDGSMGQFLNRLLSLNVDTQAKVFGEFERRLNNLTERARQSGELDTGVENYRAERLNKHAEKVVYKDSNSGAEASHMILNVKKKTEKRSFSSTQSASNNLPVAYVRKMNTGKVYAVHEAPTSVDGRTGRLTKRVVLRSPKVSSDSYENHGDVLSDHSNFNHIGGFEKLSLPDAEAAWHEEYDSIPATTETQEHFISGALLPIWNKFPGGDSPKIYRLKLDNGESVLGRHVKKKYMPTMLKNLGIADDGKQFSNSPQDVFNKLRTNQASSAKLSNGWVLKPSRVQDEKRIEVMNVDPYTSRTWEQMGGIKHKIGYETRHFIPISDDGHKVLDQVLKARNATITDVSE